jgi:hypothetical protein
VLPPTWRLLLCAAGQLLAQALLTAVCYSAQLGSYVVFGFSLNIFFAAYIYTLSEDLLYSEALWHCWVTATTVG